MAKMGIYSLFVFDNSRTAQELAPHRSEPASEQGRFLAAQIPPARQETRFSQHERPGVISAAGIAVRILRGAGGEPGIAGHAGTGVAGA